MSPIAAALSLFAALLAVYLLLAYSLRRVAVRSRVSGLGFALAFLALSALPLALMYGALRTGTIACLSNTCHGRILYSLDEQPAAYWFRLSVLFAFAAPFFAMGLQFFLFVLTHWGRLPSRDLSELALRERDKELERQQAETVDEKLLWMRSGGEIADALEPLSRQRAEIATTLRHREQMRQELQKWSFAGRVLVVGVLVTAVIMTVVVLVNRP